MHTPVAAYLRVYEPLAAFADERADYWRDYVASGRAVSPLDGPTLQRELMYQAIEPDWSKLPIVPPQAYVIDSKTGPLVCPWQLTPRMAEAVRNVDDLVPPRLIDAFVSTRLTEAAALADIEDDDFRGMVGDPPSWHECIATWHVPTRWFVCVEAGDRELSLSSTQRVLRYRVPMSRARRRVRRSYGILQNSLGKGNPVVVGTRQVSEWLAVFHPRSIVELDYGGLAVILPDAQLRDDDSPQLAHEGLAALASGDVSVAGRNYEKLMQRWRRIRLRERSNLIRVIGDKSTEIRIYQSFPPPVG